MKTPFKEEELQVIGEHIDTAAWKSFLGPSPRLNTPITARENFNHVLKRDGGAMWIPTMSDFLSIESRVNKDHIARAEVMDLGPLYGDDEKGGPDMFGIEWVFVPSAGGSMVQPGNPTLKDANDWPNVIKFPDVDAMDWAACAALNAPMNESVRPLKATFQNGLFERLISFMDFEGAAMAIIDEDQKDAVHALFARLCDLYEAMITKYAECLKLDGVMFHDDWGSQAHPFFSLKTCKEMLMPYIKRLADFCHAKGLWFEQHSCGYNEALLPAMVEAGVDMWMPQPMNPVEKMVEEYGDKIILGMYAPIGMGATHEENDAAAKAFAEKYAPQIHTKPILLVNFGVDQEFVQLVYKYSRDIIASL